MEIKCATKLGRVTLFSILVFSPYATVLIATVIKVPKGVPEYR
jgi:hypothetical protein